MEVGRGVVRRRVSDTERDDAVQVLKTALADGRISPDTFMLRLDAAFKSRDDVTLRQVTSDLSVRPPRLSHSMFGVATVGAQGSRFHAVALPRADSPFLSIGRGTATDLRLRNDPAVSLMHAALVKVRRTWFVFDCHSTNGVYLHGQRVSGSQRVYPGDILTLGQTMLLLISPDGQSTSIRRVARRWFSRLTHARVEPKERRD